MSSKIIAYSEGNTPIVRVGARFYTTSGSISSLIFEFQDGDKFDTYPGDMNTFHKTVWAEMPAGFDRIDYLTEKGECDLQLTALVFFKKGVRIGAISNSEWYIDYKKWSPSNTGTVKSKNGDVISSILLERKCAGYSLVPIDVHSVVDKVPNIINETTTWSPAPTPAKEDSDPTNPSSNIDYETNPNDPTPDLRYIDGLLPNPSTGVDQPNLSVTIIGRGNTYTDLSDAGMSISDVPKEESFLEKNWLLIIIFLAFVAICAYGYNSTTPSQSSSVLQNVNIDQGVAVAG